MKNSSESGIYARGKLLLTGEYVVLDGALALALPVRYGQELRYSISGQGGKLHWESRDENDEQWFWADFSLPGLELLENNDAGVAKTLREILLACRRQNPEFLNQETGCEVKTQTDFPREWGLGSSSTLIAALARWAAVDPYRVLFETLGGSGYDIACAFAGGPLLYRLQEQRPEVTAVDFKPPFAEQLFFVYLGKKQNSREGIRRYRERAQGNSDLIEKISMLTRKCLESKTVADFSAILLEHELLLSAALELPRAQDLYFPDFPGVIKSLGAWGGDFVLAASVQEPADTRAYFLKKGFSTCIGFREMVGI